MRIEKGQKFAASETKKCNQLGDIGYKLSISGLCCSILPCIGSILPILAFVFSRFGEFGKLNTKKYHKGFVMSLIGLFVNIVVTITFFLLLTFLYLKKQ